MLQTVRPDFELILKASPKAFMPSAERRSSNDSIEGDERALGGLDETGATREEQALAWATCPEDGNRNYLEATLNWIFSRSQDGKLSINDLERRLRGANIKPVNVITE